MRSVLPLLPVAVFAAVSCGGPEETPVPPREVTVAVASPAVVARIARATGRLEAAERATISSDGSVRVLSLPVSEGDRVRRGELLVRLSSVRASASAAQASAEAGTAEARLVEARERRDQAARDAERAERLYDAGVISLQEMENARTARAAADAQVAAAESALTATRRAVSAAAASAGSPRLHAPFAGVITEIYVEEGEVVGPGLPIMRIVDPSLLEARLDCAEADLAYLDPGDEVRITPDVIDTTVTGRISFVSSEVRPAGTVLAVAEIENRDEALPAGLFISAEITSETVQAVTAIPRECLALGVMGDEATVFVVEDGRAHERRIITGLAGESLIEVRSGLEVGDSVVLRGREFLEEGTPVRVNPAAPMEDEPALSGREG